LNSGLSSEIKAHTIVLIAHLCSKLSIQLLILYTGKYKQISLRFKFYLLVETPIKSFNLTNSMWWTWTTSDGGTWLVNNIHLILVLQFPAVLFTMIILK